MRPNIPRKSSAADVRRVARGAAGPAVALVGLLAGCSQIPNQFVDDSPSTYLEHNSATTNHILTTYDPAEPRQRGWEERTVTPVRGAVTHWPLYFEDPFVDKGHGRQPPSYHLGWEDVVAAPYGFARYTLNWMMLPVSMVVTPPWTLMESDGVLSRQALGYDHDATRADQDDRRETTPEPLPEQDGAYDVEEVEESGG